MKMHARAPAARDRDEIASKRAASPAGHAVGVERHRVDGPHPSAAMRGDHPVAREYLDALLARACLERPGGTRPRVDDGGDAHARVRKIGGAAIGVAVVRAHHRGQARAHGELVDIGARRVREHDPGAVVPGEDERPLDRPRRQHHLARAHEPQALPRRVGRRDRKMIGNPLAESNEIVVVISEGGGAQKEPRLGHARELGHGSRHPVERRLALDRHALALELAAQGRRLVGEDHARAGACRGQCRGQARRTAAHHQHVAMGMVLLVDGRDRARAVRCRDPRPCG